MGLFDFFKSKKKEEDYDILSMKVTDLRKNFIFEYNLSTWQVLEEYTYDWGHNIFTKEFKVSDGKNTFYLSVEEDDEVEIYLCKKVALRSVRTDLPDYITKNERPPKEIVYNGIIFYLDEEAPGYFNDGTSDSDDNWDELISWTYYNTDDDKILTIEQWDEHEFEASFGNYVKEIEISNILPHD